MTAKAPAKGHPAKHSPAKKHPPAPQSSAKHAAHVAHLKHLHHLHMEHLAHLKAVGKPATPAKPAKPRAFAIGDLLPVCALEAVAMSLRLAGEPVSPDEVVSLWEAAGSPEAGVTIAEALAAFGLAAPPAGTILGVTRPGYHAVLAVPDGWWSWGALYSPWDARVEEAWGVSWG